MSQNQNYPLFKPYNQGHKLFGLSPLCPEWLRIRLKSGHNKKGYVPTLLFRKNVGGGSCLGPPPVTFWSLFCHLTGGYRFFFLYSYPPYVERGHPLTPLYDYYLMIIFLIKIFLRICYYIA